jgi:putative copper export protein
MLTAAALTVVAFNALAQSASPRYMIPVAPTFILLAAAALLGHARPPDPTN